MQQINEGAARPRISPNENTASQDEKCPDALHWMRSLQDKNERQKWLWTIYSKEQREEWQKLLPSQIEQEHFSYKGWKGEGLV